MRSSHKRRLWLPMTIAVAMLANLVTSTHAQSPAPDWQIAAGGKMQFDVASVKQNKSNDNRPHMNLMLAPGDTYSPTSGIFSASNIPLFMYISFAYNLTPNQWSALQKQLPDWAMSDKFDMEARSDDHDATKDQMRLMMQALLADRFKLAVHRETQQVPVFDLELAKPGKLGPHLRQHATDVPCPGPAAAGSASPAAPSTVPGGYPLLCGGVVPVAANVPGRITAGARNVTMSLIASTFAGLPDVARPVLDQTGLKGTFDFTIDFTLPNPAAASDNGQQDASSVTIMEALKEQLGLKLVPAKGPVEVYVVDHIEHPSAN